MRAKRTVVTAALVVAFAGAPSGIATADPTAPDPSIPDPSTSVPTTSSQTAPGLTSPVPSSAAPSSPSATPAEPPTPQPTTPDAAAPGTGTPPGPKTTIDADGTYAVGTDIVPGVYSTAGPIDNGTCFWRRASNPDGATIDNALTKKPQTVLIDPTDKSFKTNGCQPWQLTDGAAPPPETSPALAGLKLQAYMAQLNARAAASGQTTPP